MTEWLNLSQGEITALVVICFLAGVVRGFAGFALSALVMAVAVLFLAPIELIPILWFLELTASFLMVRQGFAQADRSVALGLLLGVVAGVPIGLSLTTSLPVETSRMIALALILVLAGAQLARIRIAFLETFAGVLVTGVVSGIVTGLANIGGMVVALFVLSRNSAPNVMRATLVVYLFASAFNSLVYLLLFGIMTQQSLMRALILIPPTALGVIVGRAFFTERLSAYYRPFCLVLLLSLAAISLFRELLR